MVFSDLPKHGGKEPQNKQTSEHPNTLFQANPSPEEHTRERAGYLPFISEGSREGFLLSTTFSQGGEGLMQVDLSREELEEAIGNFILGKTGIHVKGKKVTIHIDRITEEVSGASVSIDRDSDDGLPPLGRHTA
jgi:hypothetical protein